MINCLFMQLLMIKSQKEIIYFLKSVSYSSALSTTIMKETLFTYLIFIVGSFANFLVNDFSFDPRMSHSRKYLGKLNTVLLSPDIRMNFF